MGAGQAANQQTLAAFSLGTGRNLWVATVNLKYQAPFDTMQPVDWPVVVDLDGDGRSELVVPDSGPMPPADGYRGVHVVDGQSGQTRWIRPMRPETKGQDGLLHILDAPDLDHDGVRDLVMISFFLGRYLTTEHNGTPPVPERLYVDAFREKTAIHCGGGTTIMGRSGLCSSGAYDGGGAGLMVGRSWPFHSASVPATFLR